MRRRKFIAGISVAAAWPLVSHAQQHERMRRIGVLMSRKPDDALGKARITAFIEEMQKLGWNEGRNIQFDVRWTEGNAEEIRRYATELVGFTPDVILASGGTVVGPLLQVTRSVPVVFTVTPDPVGAGFVGSLARPGGNATGFTQFEYGIGAQWLALLKEIAPAVTRAAILRDSAIPEGMGQFGAIQAVAASKGVEVSPIGVRDPAEIERDVAAFARPNSGLIVTGSALAALHRNLITALSVRHKLPAVYPERPFVAGGGLISYGADSVEPHRRAASYVNRILKGEKPADMPVQAASNYRLVVNLKTATALGLDVPHALLARADEVIE